jgi:hypothetical protein
LAHPNTGLLLFMEEPSATVARWRDTDVTVGAGVAIVSAVHHDLLDNLATADEVRVYLAPAAESDAGYVSELASGTQASLLEVPRAAALQRWDSGLSILYNRCSHRKVICADGRVPDVYAEDLARARRKLDLYQMIIGREGEDRCWLIGMNSYLEILAAAEARPEDLLHPILETAGRLGLDISVLDTKHALTAGASLHRLQGLSRRPQHPGLARALADHGLSPPATPGA